MKKQILLVFVILNALVCRANTLSVMENQATTSIIIEAIATDKIAIVRIDNKTPWEENNTWELYVTTGTVKTNIAKADVTLTGLPAGLDYTVAKGTGNTIVITLTGAATTALTPLVTATINGSAVTEAGAQNSAGISLNLGYMYMEEVTTFILTNEGGLIDKLIAAGHGDKSLYQVLELLQPVSGGVITDDFMDRLASTPAGSEIFTAPLSAFAGRNNPVCINADGTISLQPIYGLNYFGKTGYSSYPETLVLDIANFIVPNSPVYYIFAGDKVNSYGGGTIISVTIYKAFAIAWMPSIIIEATATDDVAILHINNKAPSARDKTWELNVTTGTVKTNITKADVTLSGLPAGLDYTVAKGTGNTIVITLTGEATTALTADATITATINSSAVTEGAQNSAGIALNLWYVGEATTFVLTNEGGLIDKLIAAGHGDKSLYQVLELLKPVSGDVLTDRFMKTLASTPAGSEIFTATLSPFSGLNNPVGINADGTLVIASIYGRDYYGKTSYTTIESNLNGVGTVSFTTADDAAHLIDAGERVVSAESTGHYKAFAIVWMPDTTTSVNDLVKNDNMMVYPNPAKGVVWFKLPDYESVNSIEIYDMQGRQVFYIGSIKENNIDLSGLKNGTYLLQIETLGKIYKQKIIKY